MNKDQTQKALETIIGVVSQEGRVKELLGEDGDDHRRFVFLGGTTGGPDWREAVLKLGLDMDYFNPKVEVWTDQSKELEDIAKKNATLQLYVITPWAEGHYSIAELTEASVNNPAAAIVCYLDELDGKTWTEHQRASNQAVIELVRKYGVKVATTLKEVVEHINYVEFAIAKLENNTVGL